MFDYLKLFVAVDVRLVTLPILSRFVEIYSRSWYIYFTADRLVCAIVAVVECARSEFWWCSALAIDALQIFAIVEGILANRGYTLRYGYRLQTQTLVECVVCNSCYSVGYFVLG